MKKLLRNLLPAFLIVGILASCETTDPLIQEAQKNIFTQNYDSALAMLDRSIQKDSTNGVPYYYKALTYAEKARTISEAAERKPDYRNFRTSAVQAREVFSEMEEQPSEAEDVTPLILNTWGYEHNKAIEYINDDSVRATVESPLKKSVAHLENAVIVNPDSTLSWDILAQVLAMDNNFEEAIAAQRSTMDLKNPPPAEDFLRLGVYLRNAGNTEDALSTLETGVEQYPDSVSLVQNLADVYMEAGQREKSISTIEQLIQRDPSNAQYRLALGTQLLQATTEISDEITANYDRIYDLNSEIRNNADNAEELQATMDSLRTVNKELTEEMNDLSADAEAELIQVTELRPEDPQAFEYLAISFQNKAIALYEERNFTTDNELASELDQQGKEQFRKAMEYYEKAVELDPENQSYWRSLYRIYLQLDMQEKAEEAAEKAGM